LLSWGDLTVILILVVSDRVDVQQFSLLCYLVVSDRVVAQQCSLLCYFPRLFTLLWFAFGFDRGISVYGTSFSFHQFSQFSLVGTSFQ
jgi:hypothetical protein